MNNDAPTQTRRARLGRHLRRNLVGYVALLIAVSLTPLPSWAAATIGTADIKNSAVTTKKLAKNAVKAGKLGGNAVTSPKIKDGSIGKVDLAAEAQGFTGFTVERAQDSTVANGESVTLNVDCGSGRRAIGGGGYLDDADTGVIQRSLPVNPIVVNNILVGWLPAVDGNTTSRGWQTAVLNDSGTEDIVYAYAICASK